MDRRKLIAAAAALPITGAAALAQPAESDPIIPVFREWQETLRDFERSCAGYAELERRYGGQCEEARAFEVSDVIPACDRRSAVEARIAQIIPTTVAGLAAQLTVACAADDAPSGAKRGNTDCCLLVSMLTGAENMAGVAS